MSPCPGDHQNIIEYLCSCHTINCADKYSFYEKKPSRFTFESVPLRKRSRLRSLLQALASRYATPDGARCAHADAIAIQRICAERTGLPAGHLAPNPPGLKWLGLELRNHAQQDAVHATVEFIARSRLNGQANRLHEVSRFVRENNQWFYVDGYFVQKPGKER